MFGYSQTKLVSAFREIYADLRSDINDMIYQQLEERKFEYQKGFDFFGLMDALVRRAGFRGDDAEDVLQKIITQMFARSDGKTVFDRYTPGKASKLERWFYTAVYRRVSNALADQKRRRRERPEGLQPSEGGGMSEDRIPGRGTPEGADVEYEELIDRVRTWLGKHRLSERLLEIFDMLLRGMSKGDIAMEMGFKSPSRLSYYLKELKNSIRSFVLLEGDPELIEALSKALR